MTLSSDKSDVSILIPDCPESEAPAVRNRVRSLIRRIGAFRLRPESQANVVTCIVTRYTQDVIVSFKHKGLEQLYRDGTKRGVQPDQVRKLIRILSVLDVAISPADLAVPSFRAHPLKGSKDGYWSIWVNGNWRVTFRFVDSDVELVGYADYH